MCYEGRTRRIRATLATTDYVPSYGGVRLSLEQLESMLQSLKAGKVQSRLFHDSRRPLHVENIETGIKTAPAAPLARRQRRALALAARPPHTGPHHEGSIDQRRSYGAQHQLRFLARRFRSVAAIAVMLDQAVADAIGCADGAQRETGP
jgi:hypothetical protein